MTNVERQITIHILTASTRCSGMLECKSARIDFKEPITMYIVMVVQPASNQPFDAKRVSARSIAWWL